MIFMERQSPCDIGLSLAIPVQIEKSDRDYSKPIEDSRNKNLSDGGQYGDSKEVVDQQPQGREESRCCEVQLWVGNQGINPEPRTPEHPEPRTPEHPEPRTPEHPKPRTPEHPKQGTLSRVF